ncbi:hypothetical protein T484DRAFT_1819073, partial [Baffinella frigidus]
LDVRIQVAAPGVFYTLDRLFATSEENIFGVVGGAKPFRVMPPGWTMGVVAQAVPFLRFANTITVTLQATINLAALDASSLTISNLAGAIAPEGVPVTVMKNGETLQSALFCLAGGLTSPAGESPSAGSWDAATDDLTLTLCAGQTLDAIAVYVLRFAVANPEVPQPAPSISIAATGTATFPVEALIKPSEAGSAGAEVFGVEGGVDALFVMLPAFEARSIAQDSIFPSSVNLMTVTIHANVDLAEEHSAIISLCCFSNAIVAGSQLPIRVSGSGTLPRFCADASGTGGAGRVLWNAATRGIDMHLCPGDLAGANKVSSKEAFVVAFNVTNPGVGQAPPTVSISASATFPASGIAQIATSTPGFAILGVTRGSDPMRVVVPDFLTKSVVQSTPVSGYDNTVTARFAVSVELSGRDASIITLSNFSGAAASDVVTLQGVPGGNAGEYLFCLESGTDRAALWDRVPSSVTLRLCAGQTLHVGQEYAIAFTVRNPDHDQESPLVLVEATGVQVRVGTAPVVKSTASILGLLEGAAPLRVVVPRFMTKVMQQSTPISSVVNTIIVTLRSSISLSASINTRIAISHFDGYVQSATSITIQDAGDQPFAALICKGTASRRMTWTQAQKEIVLEVCAGRTIVHSTDYVFSFAITNPGADQASPAIQVGAYTTMAVIADSLMVKSHALVVGVVNGSDPLQIVVPIFNEKLVSQSTPLPGFNNTLTLHLRSSINLQSSDFSQITISGFFGAVADPVASLSVLKNGLNTVDLFCEADSPAGGNYGVWDYETWTLVVKICSGQIFEAGSRYEVKWVVQNPQVDQASPLIRISAVGTAKFLVTAVSKPGADILGVSNGVDPLLVITPTFVTKMLAQSNFLAEEENLITATLMTNVDVGSAGYAFISICCLDSAATSGSEVAVQVRGTGDAIVPRFCGGVQGSGDEGFGIWNSSSFEISFHLCARAENDTAKAENETANMVESFSEYVVSFYVTNPAWHQNSSSVIVWTDDYFRIAEASMNKPGVVYSGVKFGSDPLKVVVPEFSTRAIGQSTPFDRMVSRITVTLVSTVELTGVNNVDITITGLNAGPQAASNLALEGADAGLFCTGAVSSTVRYNASTGIVHMVMCPLAVLHAEEVHRVSFELTNPPFTQPSSVNLITADSTSAVPVESFCIPNRAMTVQGQTVWDVVNATDPVRVLYPTFEFGHMAQSNFYGGQQNFLTLEFTTNVQLGCAETYCHSLTIQVP